jgi:PST family polysaccharide transporter
MATLTSPPSQASAQGFSLADGLIRWLGGRAGTTALQFATLVVLARALGPERFGLAQFSFVIFGYGIVLNDLGLTTLGTRESGRPTSRIGRPGGVVGARLLLSVPFIIAMVAAATSLARDGQAAAAVVAIGVLFAAFNHRWLLQADHDFGRLAALEVGAAAIQFLGALLVYALGGGWIAGLIVLVSGPTIQAIASVAVAARRHGVLLVPSVGRATVPLIRVALPLGVALVVTAVYYSFDSFLLGLTRTPEEVGLYGAAYRIVLAALLLPIAAHGVALPIVGRLSDGSPPMVRPLLLGLSVALLTVALPVAVVTTLYAGPIVRLVLGPEYSASAPLLSLLIWSLVTVSANVPFAVVLLAERRDRSYMVAPVIGAVVSVTLDIALVPAFGPIAAAIVTLISEVTVLTTIVWLTRAVSVPLLLRAFGLASVPAVGVAVGAIALPGAVPVAALLSLVGWLVAMLALHSLGVYRQPLAALFARTEVTLP